MKTFDERRKNVEHSMEKMQKTRRKRLTACTSAVLVVAILVAVLFVPFDKTPPSVEKHRNDSYYDLIQKINLAMYQPPEEDNIFDVIYGGFTQIAGGLVGDADFDAAMMSPSADAENTGSYVEVTDNQVAGVTEADIIKRTTDHIFYLSGNCLEVYSIAQEDSQKVGSFTLQRVLLPGETVDETMDTGVYRHFAVEEMYLSEDCSTVTVILQAQHFGRELYTEVVSLDVTDLSNIRETNRVFLTGQYLSSRMTNGMLLMIGKQRIDKNYVDFADPATFVPQLGTADALGCVLPDDIVCPDELTYLQYTVIGALDAKTLEVQDSAAFLSYSEELYVSGNMIFATRGFVETTESDADGYYTQTAKTEITGIAYGSGELTKAGSIVLDGTVKNQYSLDQYQGILRVVTSTTVTNRQNMANEDYAWSTVVQTLRNVDLTCIDLSSWQVAASVTGFAPEGETAESVRFDGEKAYVCTAEVIKLTDPVYFFDLSDLQNITWTDTGTIDGFSSSLIQLQDGFLLGIGYGDRMQLKLEVYAQGIGGVDSICTFELNCSFSEAYKSYFIDRENNIFGLAVDLWEGDQQYFLLHFDGYQFHILETVGCSGSLDQVRGVVIDGYLYVLSNWFSVQKVW